jgi:hypothetical protein
MKNEPIVISHLPHLPDFHLTILPYNPINTNAQPTASSTHELAKPRVVQSQVVLEPPYLQSFLSPLFFFPH